MRLAAPRNRGHYRNGITVFDRSGLFLQVADIFVVQVDVHESPQFAVVGVKVATQVRMLGDKVGEGFGDRARLDLHRSLLAGILAQRGWNVDLRHALDDATKGVEDSASPSSVVSRQSSGRYFSRSGAVSGNLDLLVCKGFVGLVGTLELK